MRNAEPNQGMATAGEGSKGVATPHVKQMEFGRLPSVDLIDERGGDAMLCCHRAPREAEPAA